MKKLHIILVFGAILANAEIGFAASCAEYPFTVGGAPEIIDADHYKFLYTSSVAVQFDDISAINDAREEATLEAKAGIAKYLEESLKSDTSINKIVDESVTMQGNQKIAQKKEVKETLKKLGGSTQALLRGVAVLGDCYTKSEEVRVTVGIKSDSIDQAGKIAGAMSNSLAVQATPKSGSIVPNTGGGTMQSNGSSSAPSQQLKGNDGFNNTDRLRNF